MWLVSCLDFHLPDCLYERVIGSSDETDGSAGSPESLRLARRGGNI